MDYRIYPGLIADEKTVIKTVYEYFNLKLEDFYIKTRKREFITPKQISIYFLHKRYKLKSNVLENMYKNYSGFDHANILYAAKTVKNLCETDKKYKDNVDKINLLLDQFINMDLSRLNIKYKGRSNGK